MKNVNPQAQFRSAPATMMAAVLEDVASMAVRQVPAPAPQPHEVRVRVEAVGLCGTDVHIFAGHANYHRDAFGRLVPLSDVPQILGHEIAGVVAEVGHEVRDLRPGDAVVVDQGRTCIGDLRHPPCEYCQTGDSHQCEFYAEHGITGLPGGLAEYIVVPAVNVVQRRGSLPAYEAALTEPLGCIVHSLQVLRKTAARYELGGENPVRTILVMGAGPAGLLFIQYLRRVVKFDGPLLVIEPNEGKRQLAERFGAETIDPGLVDPIQFVHDRTGGRRTELVIEASGSAHAFASIPALMRKQGTLLLYGHGHSGMDLSTMSGVQYLEPTLLTPVGASGGFDEMGRPLTYIRALQLLEEGTIEVAPLVSHRYPSLQHVQDALLTDYHDPDYKKGVVTFNSTST